VTHRRRLREVFIEAEGACDRARQLADLEGVGESGARVITDMGYEDLGLVFETAKGTGVEDSVAITLKCETKVRLVVFRQPPSGGLG
jgi:hypothetical protein